MKRILLGALLIKVLAACSSPEGDGDADPDTLLGEQPAALSSSAAATISFSSPAAGATFECRLDGHELGACASPLALSNLGDGVHELEVRAVRGQRRDPTPARVSWTVDTTPPETSITSGPRGETTDPAAAYAFACDTPPCTFECRLDEAPFAACAPGDGLALPPGSHTFAVRARDGAGNVDATPAQATVVLRSAARAVVITAAPADPTNERTASFAFVCREDDRPAACDVSCVLDDGAAAPCASPVSFAGLDERRHRLVIGGAGTQPAQHAWTVDLTPPAVTIVTGPTGGASVGPSVLFGYRASEPARGFACALDGGDFVTCEAAGRTFTGLGAGPHTFAVRATDLAGNTGEPATASFRVDGGAPVVKILGPLADEVVCAPARVTFATVPADDVVAFSCALDGGPFQPCAAPGLDVAQLAGGRHTVTVRATDAAATSGEASVSFTVDAVAPVAMLSGPAVSCPTGGIDFTATDALAPAGGAPVVASCTIAGDGAAPVPCTVDDAGKLGYRGLSSAGGAYTVSLVVKDACGNASAPATRRFEVDSIPPVVTISSPAGEVCPSGAMAWKASDGEGPSIGGDLRLLGASVDGSACAPDGKVCKRGEGGALSFAGLDGNANPHRALVRVADACGNAGEGAASFDVDSAGPELGPIEAASSPNTGAVRLGAAPSGDLVALAAVLDLGGGAPLSSCDCAATACTCTGLAAGVNRISVRGRDRCDNAGHAAVREVTASFGPYDGHAVLIGHDYTGDDAPGALVGNAVSLTPFVHHGLRIQRGEVRILAFRPAGVTDDVVARVTAAVRAGLEAQGLRAAITDFSDPADLEELLPGRDVLLLYDPPETLADAALYAAGQSWAGFLVGFAERGGVVIGLGRRSWELMTGGNIGLIATYVESTLQSKLPTAPGPIAREAYPAEVTGAKPFRVASGVGSYLLPAGSFCQPVTDFGAAVVYEQVKIVCSGDCRESTCPLVVDKLFPEYRIDVAVTPDDGSDLPTCVPPVIGLEGRGGSFAVAGARDGDPAGTFACLWGPGRAGRATGRCDAGDGDFTLDIPDQLVSSSLEAHLDIALLRDGEPARIGRAPFIADNTIVAGAEPTQPVDSCGAAFFVYEDRPPVSDRSCQIAMGDSMYEPFRAITCVLERDPGDGTWVEVARKTDEGCGAVPDDRGGFVSNGAGMRADWTKEIHDNRLSGDVRMSFTAEDFHGNAASSGTRWRIIDPGLCQ